MLEWMFWEQYSHEPYVAVARFRVRYLKQDPAELDPKLLERARAALERMDRTLEQSRFLVGDRCSLADVALVAYSRVAPEGGIELEPYPALEAWIGRVDSTLGIGS